MGLLLIAGSVALGAWAVDRASATEPVFAARDVLMAGRPIGPSDLVVVEANPAAPAGTYLGPGDLDEGVMLRSVGAGELLPAAAVAPAATLEQRPLVVDVDGSLPVSIGPGAVVELWVTPSDSGLRPGEESPAPSMVASGLEVSRVTSDSSMLGGGARTAVELLASPDDVPGILAAKSAGGGLVVVPISSARAPAAEPPASGDEPGALDTVEGAVDGAGE